MLKTEKNILIRGISLSTVKAFDRKVNHINLNRQGKNNISRNQLILSLLDEQKNAPLLEYQKTKFDQKIDQLLDINQEYIRAVNRVIYLLMTGNDDEALNLFDDLAHLKPENKKGKDEV